jgi:hypothetical protein
MLRAIFQHIGFTVVAQVSERHTLALQLRRMRASSEAYCGAAGETSKVEVPSEAEMGSAGTQPIEE